MLPTRLSAQIASICSKKSKRLGSLSLLPLKVLTNKPYATYTHNSKNDSNGRSAELVVRQDGSLRQTTDWDSHYEWDDKFGLSSITDIRKIFSLLRQANYNYKLNDLIQFLRRIAELNEQYQLKLDKHNSSDLETLVKHIKTNLKNSTQDYPYIGSIASCFQRLNYQKDEELWMILGDYIIDDRYYPNFRESVFGMEGFTVLMRFADKNFVDKVYERLERTCFVTIWETNMTYYQRIAKSLVEVDRSSPKLFQKVEYHVMRNLDMEYSLNTMLDILFHFAKSGNGSKDFFHSMQFIVFKGHMFNKTYSLWRETPQDASFVAKLCEVYRRAAEKYPDLVLEPNFAGLAHKLITNKKTKYKLEDLVQVLENFDVFQFEDIDEIDQLLDKKLFEIEDPMNAHDMIRYIDIVSHRRYEGDYSKIPEDVLKLFDTYLKKNILSQDPRGLYYYVFDIEARGLIHQYDPAEFMNKLVEYVGTKLNSYDFEDMCYYFWLFNKYHHLIDAENKQVQHNMNLIKDHIRLYSAFSKGRIKIGSNFYKMLEVVTGSEFLTQGEYPDW